MCKKTQDPKKTQEDGLTSSCYGSQSAGRIRSVLDMENRQCFYALLWRFQEKDHATCLWRNMLRYRRDTADRRSKERTGFSSGQARMETFSFREESLSRCYNAAINLKTIRYYIITQGKGLPRRRYFHMMLTNTMY